MSRRILLLVVASLFMLSGALPVAAQRTEPIASYDMVVTLDADTKQLTAVSTITYVNRTTEPIPDLVFHLYLNAFRDTNSIFLRESGTQHRGEIWDPNAPGWIEVTSLALADGTPLDLELIEDDTLARADLPTAVLPGESIVLDVAFTAQLPRVFARTGFVDDFFLVGQWFPKLGVWEEGAWNAYPFHANSEFYADFGTYNVAITLPDNYVTGGTGLLVEQIDNGDGTQTAVYHAEDVIDFAWTASPHFLSESRTINGTEILYLYLPEHEWSVERVLPAAAAAVTLFSDWYGPYPYERLTVVDVPDNGGGAGGMEYPTFVTVGPVDILGIGAAENEAILGSEIVTIHEVGHQWWQSMVAFNEAEEPWLDEGFTDYSTLRAMDVTYGEDSGLIDSRFIHLGYLEAGRLSYLSDVHVPMAGAAWEFGGTEYQTAVYSKPALSLRTLENVLGEEMMNEVMRTFFQQYQFKHPNTEDFWAVAESVSGQTLDWFFAGLVYSGNTLNYAVSEIDAMGFTAVREGDLVIPTTINVLFSDGSSTLLSWDGTPAEKRFDFPDRAEVIQVEIDPERKLVVETQWGDNGRSRTPDIPAWLAIATRLLYTIQDALLMLGGL
ncbi:MAG: M1 family metallopeptidase [Chloroflexota bacterium]